MEPAPELAQLAEHVFRAWEGRDHRTVIEVLSPDPSTLVIGTDPGEWWIGTKEVSAVLRLQWEEMPPFRLDIGEISAWKEGTVGWIAVPVSVTFEAQPPVLVRSTAVLRREGAYWHIVQWHNSIAVANEEAVGVGLTTTVDDILADVQDRHPPLSAMAGDGSVAIAFTDVVGSTALMETLGEDRWLALLDWHNEVVTRHTALFGGSVVKGQGDGFMLAFPAAGSAAACAVAIQRALEPGWEGIPVAARIGIHCGNAKAEAGDFFGRTVVLAARISAAAGAGEVLVSDDVEAGLAGTFGLGTSRSLLLKGIAEPQEAFPLTWNRGS
ncbi:MAG TPA: nuclear transport factor 2 family protein [Acidimicrobiales bacterium]|nr:nuclear transport factor 2 family protein [Acidimicrobiales bacterium]